MTSVTSKQATKVPTSLKWAGLFSSIYHLAIEMLLCEYMSRTSIVMCFLKMQDLLTYTNLQIVSEYPCPKCMFQNRANMLHDPNSDFPAETVEHMEVTSLPRASLSPSHSSEVLHGCDLWHWATFVQCLSHRLRRSRPSRHPFWGRKQFHSWDSQLRVRSGYCNRTNLLRLSLTIVTQGSRQLLHFCHAVPKYDICDRAFLQ